MCIAIWMTRKISIDPVTLNVKEIIPELFRELFLCSTMIAREKEKIFIVNKYFVDKTLR